MNRERRLLIVNVAWLLVLLALMIFVLATPKAHADMCGPTPGLPSYSNHWVKSCRLYVPGTGGLIPAIPVVQPPNGTYPVPIVGGTGGILGQHQPGSDWTPLP